MSVNDIVAELTEVALQIEEMHAGTRWYLFGSALSTMKNFADIDIAVIGPCDEACRATRAALAGLAGRFPLHLMLLTQEESNELRFVECVGAQLIFPRLAYAE